MSVKFCTVPFYDFNFIFKGIIYFVGGFITLSLILNDKSFDILDLIFLIIFMHKTPVKKSFMKLYNFLGMIKVYKLYLTNNKIN